MVLIFLLLISIPKAIVDVKRNNSDRINPNSINSMGLHGISALFFWIIVMLSSLLFLTLIGGNDLLELLFTTWFK